MFAGVRIFRAPATRAGGVQWGGGGGAPGQPGGHLAPPPGRHQHPCTSCIQVQYSTVQYSTVVYSTVQLGSGHSGGLDNSSGQQPGLITADSCPANPAPTHNDNLLLLSVTPDQEV